MFGQFMPFAGTSRNSFIKDPYQSYVIMSLHMEDSGNGFTLVDSSGNNNTFTRTAGATLTSAEKKFGESAINFSGTGSYYYSAAKSLYNQPGDFTVEFWCFNRGGMDTYAGLVSHATSASWSEPSCMIWRNDGRIKMKISGGDNRIVGPVAPVNRWFHVSYGRSNGVFYMYVDGVLSGRYANSSSWTGWSCTLGTCGWQRVTSGYSKLKGGLDELRWWKGISIRDGVTNFDPPKLPWGDA